MTCLEWVVASQNLVISTTFFLLSFFIWVHYLMVLLHPGDILTEKQALTFLILGLSKFALDIVLLTCFVSLFWKFVDVYKQEL